MQGSVAPYYRALGLRARASALTSFARYASVDGIKLDPMAPTSASHRSSASLTSLEILT